MRSRILRKRGTTFIQNPAEVKKKQIPWGKYAYIVVLCFLGTSAVKWGYGKIFYVRGLGFLESETKHVEAPVTGRIMDIKCKINDVVSKGEPLIFINNPRFYYAMNRRGALGGSGYGIDEHKLIDIKSQVSLLKKEIEQSREVLRTLKEERHKARSLLEAHAITRPQLVRLEDKMKTSANHAQLLKIKLDAAERILELYLGQRGDLTEVGTGVSSGGISEGILYASSPGVVSRIYKQEGEVAKVGEPVIQIVDQKKNFIKAYFSGNHENEIRVGDEAKICFETGEKSSGIVRKIYPTASSQPSELRKKFGPAQRYIIAEIVREDGKPWKRILETEVEVSVRKKWF